MHIANLSGMKLAAGNNNELGSFIHSPDPLSKRLVNTNKGGHSLC
jgi:hypothetical protein